MKDFLLDLLFPKYCIGCKKFGEYLCPDCFANIKFSTRLICAVCEKSSIDGLTHPKCMSPRSIDGIIAGVEYAGIIKKLVYQLKYEPYVRDLARPGSELLYEALIQHETAVKFVTQKATITSVPLSKNRHRKRGYNQAEVIAQHMSVKFQLPYLRLLKRKKDTKPQFDLMKKERLKNVMGAFEIQKNGTVPEVVILIDDVTTTGATMRECAKVLKRNGTKKVLGVAFSRE